MIRDLQTFVEVFDNEIKSDAFQLALMDNMFLGNPTKLVHLYICDILDFMYYVFRGGK